MVEWRALASELRPEPGRWRRAARVGLITALGAGAMAAMQISNPLGLTLLVNFALPEAAFSAARGAELVGFAAVFQMLGLALVGALVNAPVAHVTAFVLICLYSSYWIYAVPTLGRLWVWIQVPVVTAFYMAMFLPGDELGRFEAEGFAGIAVAVGVLLVCNAIMRPEPVESVLANSIAASLERSRAKFAALFESLAEADDTAADAGGEQMRASARPLPSSLGRHLALLERALALASSAAKKAALLADVTLAEAVRVQTERLEAAVRALRRGGRQSPPAAPQGAPRALWAAIDRRLERAANRARLTAAPAALAPAERLSPVAAAARTVSGSAAEAAGMSEGDDVPVDHDAFATRLARLEPQGSAAAPVAAALARMLELLESDALEFPPDGESLGMRATQPPRIVRNILVRFSTRHTIALSAAFLLGLWDNNPALHAAIWLLMLGGPPSHGATVGKFTMRAIGASGALALAALGTIAVAPNFTSPAAYMAAIFAGTVLMAYVGEGGGILSYLAIGGTAFVIAYGGPGPRTDVLGSIWSIWGISLGMMIRAGVSMLWREHPSRTLAEQFQAPLAAIVELIDARNDPAASQRRAAAAMGVIEGIERMLTVANDAMLEGSSAEIDGAELVGALDTLRRLAFVAASANAHEQAGARDEIEQVVRARISAWLENLRGATESGAVSRAPLRRMVAEAGVPAPDELPAYREAPTPHGEGATAEKPARTAVTARIVQLTRRLERELSAVSRYS
ncbi:MAG TPA: hypothetical protein VKT27_02985 [Candidatus Binataceae bacterium]|nr:hypothetical protein [Candidatus Binataceae bacterium]